jgi:dCTP deaminase
MQHLSALVSAGAISGVPEKFINPASIDLPLSDEAYRLESISLPHAKESIRKLMRHLGATPHDLRNPLEVGVPYLIRVEGTWEMPPHVYGYANPKSSAGRVNLFCRSLADGIDMYDKLGEEWCGQFWLLVRTDSFPIKLSPMLAISQIRLFNGPSFISELEGDIAIKKHGLIFDERRQKIGAGKVRKHKDSFMLTIDVGELMGWECRGSQRVLDFGKLDTYDPSEFFERISTTNGMFTLRKDSFYILSTLERIMVPPNLSAELRAIDPRFGLFETHRAGFIDPGWGWGADGSAGGRPITLEVTPYENMLVRHGQAIARIRFEHMLEEPTKSYDAVASNYTVQEGPKLSKHFKNV